MTDIKTNILQFVEKNKISMIPRWKFILYSLLGMTLTVFAFVVLTFFGSMIIFILSKYGFIYLPLFGLGGIMHGIRAVPFVLFILTVILIVIVEILVHKYAFSFRKPVITTLLTLTLSAIVFSSLLTLTPMHGEIRRFARENHIDFISRGYDRPLPIKEVGGMTVLRGTIVSTTTNDVTIKLFDDTTEIVYASTSIKDNDLPDTGEDVVILGHMVEDKFEAVRIRDADNFPFGEYVEKRHGRMMSR
ncbi:MAG: hypothetical protein NTW35_00890 [Candidatus Nomurabacteria bacterium]|nr:hypothetical protein [Candidatus Nomurabacteria bacterium]